MALFPRPGVEFVQMHTQSLVLLKKTSKESAGFRVVTLSMAVMLDPAGPHKRSLHYCKGVGIAI